MKIRYLLKRRGPKSGTHPVYLALYDGDDTQIIYSDHRLTLKEWSAKERQPKDHTSEASKALEKLRADVQKAIRRLEAQEQPVTPFTVKQEYNRGDKEKQAQQADKEKQAKLGLMTMTRLMDKYVKLDLYKYRPSTQKAVRDSIGRFRKYLAKKGMLTLEKRDLNQAIVDGFERSMIESGKLSDSTVARVMKHLRWFCRSIEVELKIKSKSFTKKIVTLTQEELTALERVNVSDHVELQKAKDMWLLGAYTGLRISDLKRLNPVNTKDGVIEMTLLKNQKRVKIIIVSECDAILAKYDYHAPKISEQALNECIKKVCQKAGITQPVEVETRRGGKLITKSVPKYSLITSHIAGKSFITLAPERWGLTPADIAHYVGKDLKTLLSHYFGDQGEEARRKILAIESAKMKAS